MSNQFNATIAMLLFFPLLLGCQERYSDPDLAIVSELTPSVFGSCKPDQRLTKTIDVAGDFQLQSTGVGDGYGAPYQVTSSLHGCLFSFTHDLDPNLEPPFAQSPPSIFQISELTSAPEFITVEGSSYPRFVSSDKLAREIIREKRRFCLQSVEATQERCAEEIRNWIAESTAILEFTKSGKSVSISLVDSKAYFMEVRLK
ncbi:hypothetical protein BZA02_11122 [Ruegeria sp. P4]|nr:hypothetical protein BZA02_11122 [Ruegeria sp. P4]